MKQIAFLEKKWIVFSLVATAVFMSTLDSSIVNIALPVIMKDLKVPFTTIEWVPMIYLLTVSSFLLPFGRLSDIKGRRWVYCRGFFVFSAGSLLCGTAPDAIWIIVARSLQGIGAAMLMACSPALVVDIFPASERGKALGMVGTVVAAGLITGPLMGGLIVKYFTWRIIFYVNIPIGIVSMVLAFRILKGGKGDIASMEPFDWKGALLLVSGFSMFILAISHGHEWGFTSMRIFFLLFFSLLSMIFFIQIEKKMDYPVFQPSLLNIRLFFLPVISAFILFAGLYTMTFLMPFYLVYPHALPIDKAGYIMVVPFAFLFFASPISGYISDRIGSRILCTLGMFVLSVALLSLSTLTPSHSYFSIAWRLGLVGLGVGIFISPNNLTIMTAVTPAQRGIASGAVATSRNLGMVIGIALSGLIFNSIFYRLSNGLSLNIYKPEFEAFFMTAFKWAMFTGAMVALTGVVVTFLRGSELKKILD